MVEIFKMPDSSTKILKIPQSILQIILGKKPNYSNNQLRELYQAFVGTSSLLGEYTKMYYITNAGFVYIVPERNKVQRDDVNLFIKKRR